MNKEYVLNCFLDTTKKMINEYAEKHNIRVCSKCGHLMDNGYINEHDFSYYCSDECLHKDYTQEEYEKLYNNGFGDFYWTEWSDNK